MNLSHQAARGVWILYPVLGGIYFGGTKKHYYTPIAKYYKFKPCGNGRIENENFDKSSNIISDYGQASRQLGISQ